MLAGLALPRRRIVEKEGGEIFKNSQLCPTKCFIDMNQEVQQQLEHLAEMRALMERNSRFLSLSGLSGIWAGLCALAGVTAVYLWLDTRPFAGNDVSYFIRALHTERWGMGYKFAFILIGSVVLVSALAGGLFFTRRKARLRGARMWDHTSRRLLMALAVPLLAGGIFCLGILYWDLPALVAPSTLLFYGLSLVNGGKYTLHDIEYLGLSEIALGLLGVFFLGHGLELWALGFGVLHIVYGALMYIKYEGKSA